MNKPQTSFKDIVVLYGVKQVLLCVLTGFLFFVFPLALVAAVSVNLMFLYARNYVMIYGITLLITIYLGIFANQKIVQTLQHYHQYESVDYKSILLQLSMVSSIVITLVFYVIFIFL